VDLPLLRCWGWHLTVLRSSSSSRCLLRHEQCTPLPARACPVRALAPRTPCSPHTPLSPRPPQAAHSEDLQEERHVRQQAEAGAATLRKEFDRRLAELQQQLEEAQAAAGSSVGGIAAAPPAMAGPGMRCALAAAWLSDHCGLLEGPFHDCCWIWGRVVVGRCPAQGLARLHCWCPEARQFADLASRVAPGDVQVGAGAGGRPRSSAATAVVVSAARERPRCQRRMGTSQLGAAAQPVARRLHDAGIGHGGAARLAEAEAGRGRLAAGPGRGAAGARAVAAGGRLEGVRAGCWLRGPQHRRWRTPSSLLRSCTCICS
jgi:hypothetical protein